MSNLRKILVVGATGGTGRATVECLRDLGHRVTAFARSADRLAAEIHGIVACKGDVLDPVALERAVEGQDAVVVTLGISENPLFVRLFGPAHTTADVRSSGTRNVIGAMKKCGVRRLVVQTSYGVGATRHRPGFLDRMVIRLLLKPQLDDTEIQESLVRAADVEWTLVQPVHLTDEGDSQIPAGDAFISADGEIGQKRVARRSVAQVLVRTLLDGEFIGSSIAVSGDG